MIRRHFFLFAALAVVVLMALGTTYKLTIGKQKGGGAGGPPGAAGPGGKGPAGKAPGAPGRGGMPGRGGGATVTAVAVQVRTFTDRLQVLGVAKGRESITVTSNNADIIEAVRFRPGDYVKQGQVLVELRRTEEDAGILQARSDANLAKITYDRWNALADRGFAPKASVDEYAAAYERAKATLAAAESRSGDRVIRAPFSGVVGLTDIAAGALISPGTAIATLDDVSVMRVDFDIPDRYLSLIREGGQIEATNDSYPGERYIGRIAKLDTRIDERTRSIKARAEFPNSGGRLKPGMMMRVGIERGKRQSIGAPESGVNFSGGQAYVYLIGTRADGPYAQQRPIIAGTNECGFIEVTEGLQVGDRVIADGLNRIQPNQAVMVVSGPGAGRPGMTGGPAGKGAVATGPAGAASPASKGPGASPNGRRGAPSPVLALANNQVGCGVNRTGNPTSSANAPANPAGAVATAGRGPARPGVPGRATQAAAK